MAWITGKIQKGRPRGPKELNPDDYTCAACGAHELQICHCTPSEVEAAESERRSSMKNSKIVWSGTLKELINKRRKNE